MNFEVRWGFPFLAKAAVGAIVLLDLAFIAAVIWLLRRYRSRRRKKIISNLEEITNAG